LTKGELKYGKDEQENALHPLCSLGAPPRPEGDERLFVRRYSNDEIMGAEKAKNLKIPSVETAD
jgi:hypothetical protein